MSERKINFDRQGSMGRGGEGVDLSTQGNSKKLNEVNIRVRGKTVFRSSLHIFEACCGKGWGGGGWNTASPPHPFTLYLPSDLIRSAYILFKDDVSVVLLLGVPIHEETLKFSILRLKLLAVLFSVPEPI
jgi:hypothetical protein